MQLILRRRKTTKFFKIFLLFSIGLISYIGYALFASQVQYSNHHVPTIAEVKESSVTFDSQYEIVIQNTRFEGLSKNLIPYAINAKKAIKIAQDQYKLEKIDAIYYPQNKNFVIKSNHGNLDNANNKIHLEGQIHAIMQEFQLFSDKLFINLLTEAISANDNVKLDYKNSEITARSLHLKDKNLIILEGNVQTKINLSNL